jgi:hypothetical protein
MKKTGTGKSSKLNQKIITGSTLARAEMSQQMKRVVEVSTIAKAEAHTAAFKMINLNPTTHETPEHPTRQPRS